MRREDRSSIVVSSSRRPGRVDGSVEYETSDGEVRHVQAGSFVLVEDTHGKGHISRHSAEGQTVIWIALPNGLDLPSG
jgi:hypothetical protein